VIKYTFNFFKKQVVEVKLLTILYNNFLYLIVWQLIKSYINFV